MRFAILGAGALGTILGAHLVRAGHDVVMLARGARAKVLERDGLIVHGLAELRERCTVITDPAKLRETDCFAVATKAIDTLPSLEPYRHVKVGTAFSMQNGVVKDELLAEVFPRETVLGSMADFSGELLASGEVLFTRNVGLDLGETEGGSSERVKMLARTIDSAGVRCNAVGDIKTREWSKFVAWAGLVPLAALTRLNTWRYLLDENGAWIAVKLVREVAQLAAALKVPLMDLSPLPAQTLVQSSDRDAIAAVQEIGRRFQTNAPEHRMSTLQDIDRGTALEIEETLGFAVRRGRELSLQMPTLDLAYGFLKVGRSAA
jgi:2-dehydropantoate 2-reductase